MVVVAVDVVVVIIFVPLDKEVESPKESLVVVVVVGMEEGVVVVSVGFGAMLNCCLE